MATRSSSISDPSQIPKATTVAAVVTLVAEGKAAPSKVVADTTPSAAPKTVEELMVKCQER